MKVIFFNTDKDYKDIRTRIQIRKNKDSYLNKIQATSNNG